MVCGIYAEHRSIYRDIEEINKAMLIVEVLMVIADGHIRHSFCGFRCYKRGVNLFKSLPTVLVHRNLFSHKQLEH